MDISDDSVIPLLEEWKKKHDVNKNIDNKTQSLNNNNNNVQPMVGKKKGVTAPQKQDLSSEQDVTIVTSQLGGQGDNNKLAASPNSGINLLQKSKSKLKTNSLFSNFNEKKYSKHFPVQKNAKQNSLEINYNCFLCVIFYVFCAASLTKKKNNQLNLLLYPTTPNSTRISIQC